MLETQNKKCILEKLYEYVIIITAGNVYFCEGDFWLNKCRLSCHSLLPVGCAQ